MGRCTKLLLPVSLAASCLGLTACASWVTAAKVTDQNPKVKGFRYSLAAPYLLVTPTPDGTVTYQWLSLPDTSRQYAVQAHSFLALHTTQLTLEHSILTKMVAKPDSSAVASDALTQAGSVFEAKAKASAKKKEDAAAADKAALDKLKDALATAETNERATRLALAKAQGKDELLRAQKPPDKEQVFQADMELNNAQLDQQAAEDEVARIKKLMSGNAGITTSGSNADAGNSANSAANSAASANTAIPANAAAPASSAGTPDSTPTAEAAKFAKAWGPVLFRVIQTKDKVTLRAVALQAPYDTYGQPEKPTGQAAPPKASAQSVEFSGQWNKADNSLTLKPGEPSSVLLKPDQFKLALGDHPVKTKSTVTVAPGGDAFKVKFDRPLSAGKYTLRVGLKDSSVGAKTLTFEVP